MNAPNWTLEDVEVLIDMLEDSELSWVAAAELFYVVLHTNTPAPQINRIADIAGQQLVAKRAQGTRVRVQAGPSLNHLSSALEWLAWEHFNPGRGWTEFVESVGLGDNRIAQYQDTKIAEEPEKYIDFLEWKTRR